MIHAIDGFDTAAMGQIAPSIAEEWGTVKQDLGPALSAVLLGLSSLATANAGLLSSLTLWCFLAGLRLGPVMPNAIMLISEYAPQRCRSLAINTLYCGFPLGTAGTA